MRVALVYRSFHLSGSLARKTVELARHLSKHHEVHVFSIGRRTNSSLAPACTFHDVAVGHLGDGVRFSARELLTFGTRAAKQLDHEQFDVVHVCNPSTWRGDVLRLPGVARGEAALSGYSRVRFAASTVRHPGNAARWTVERRAVRNAAFRRFHVDAESVAADAERYYRIPRERILIVPPAVNLEEFEPAPNKLAAREYLRIHDPNRILFLFCGSDFQRKGLDRAIEALAATDVDADLLVLGGFHREHLFRTLAEERGIADRIHFLGSRTDAQRYYQAADVLLLPTRADVWSITPIEAMACGIPSIVTTAAGSSSVVREAGAGIVLSEPTEIRLLREAMERLARDPALRTEMGRKGYAAVGAHSWATRGQFIEEDLIAVAEEKLSGARMHRS